MSPEEIKQKRTALGLTQDELAAIFGVQRITIIRWEKGQIVPQASGMLRLAFQSLEVENEPVNSRIIKLSEDLTEKVKCSRDRLEKSKFDFLIS